jgi:hypothetical protein
MTKDRLMIAEAVVEGLISVEHLTMEEVNEMIEILANTSIQNGLNEAQSRGCIVFNSGDIEYYH